MNDKAATMDMPVTLENRLGYLDVLRGFAVMAIFIVNIKVMTAPFAYYMNASLWTGEMDMQIAMWQAVFVDHKWRTIFTALFGAGLVLIIEKSATAGGTNLGRVQRRLVWLLLFGLVHMFAIWYGDILVLYALAGLIAVYFAKRTAASLVKFSILFIALGGGMLILFTAPLALLPEEFLAEAAAMQWGTDSEALQKEINDYLGGLGGHFLQRLIMGGMTLLNTVFSGIGLLTIGIMLAGMALFKSGFLKGEWSAFSYLVSAIIGLAISWGAGYFIFKQINAAGWAFETALLWMGVQMLFGLPGAFGYAALIGLVLKTGLKLSPIAAVGRMAFTNYIACSLIGTTLAYGHGGGYFGSLTLEQLMYIVGGTFLAMLIWSPLWLAVFRFGPLEWLWRSLTYGKMQKLMK